MRTFLSLLATKTRAPLVINTMNPEVAAEALRLCQGKVLLNSVNLEDGGKQFSLIAPLARRFGAALVVGTIDENSLQGMARSIDRKLEIAARAYELLTHEYEIPPQDIYFDPLVFPCASDEAADFNSAQETIEALGLIKTQFPLCRTILGISNVSYGLPSRARDLLNSVFLHHCAQNGLDLAIAHAGRLRALRDISRRDLKLAEDVLFKRTGPSLRELIARFNDTPLPQRENQAGLPVSERLKQHILLGTKEGLREDLDAALQLMSAREILAGPLAMAMAEVGRLFRSHELMITDVLQSADVMKTAVVYLTPSLPRGSPLQGGKVLLGTVKGDVHDIGKNLVQVIFSANGLEVIDLGIRVSSQDLIEAVRMHRPDLICLSGLLVRSMHQMLATAKDLAASGIQTPLLLGGAALNRSFVENQIASAYGGGIVAYARDVMSGLELAKSLLGPSRET